MQRHDAWRPLQLEERQPPLQHTWTITEFVVVAIIERDRGDGIQVVLLRGDEHRTIRGNPVAEDQARRVADVGGGVARMRSMMIAFSGTWKSRINERFISTASAKRMLRLHVPSGHDDECHLLVEVTARRGLDKQLAGPSFYFITT
jgi:hypothetical protein